MSLQTRLNGNRKLVRFIPLVENAHIIGLAATTQHLNVCPKGTPVHAGFDIDNAPKRAGTA